MCRISGAEGDDKAIYVEIAESEGCQSVLAWLRDE